MKILYLYKFILKECHIILASAIMHNIQGDYIYSECKLKKIIFMADTFSYFSKLHQILK